MFLCLLFSLHIDTINLPEITYYDDFDQNVEVLARIVQKEAENQSREGQLAVATVVLNRANYYEKTPAQIIYERNQFAKLTARDFKRPLDKQYYDIALEVMSGHTTLHPAVLYFANEQISTNRRWIRIIQKFNAGQIEDHTFYFDPTAYTFYTLVLRRDLPVP